MSLTLTPLHHIPLIRQGDDLAEFVVNALEKNNIALEENDILVFAQKIISKAEGRAVNLVTVTISRYPFQSLINFPLAGLSIGAPDITFGDISNTMRQAL